MRKLIFAMVLGAVLVPDYGFTLGMGEIEVNSALNQQLDARIELLSSIPEDAETLIVKLASSEEFSRAGLDRPYILTSLKFKPYVEDGQVYIKVTTPKPVREPFLNFLIEIDWPKGHLLREYTILLDPPVFMGQTTPSQVSSRPAMEAATTTPAPAQYDGGGFRPAASAPVAAPVAAPMQEAAPQTAPQSVPPSGATRTQPAYAPAPSPYASGGGYRIKQGDTAWSLASRMRPDDSVSVQQMMLAMLRTNPEVFINGNVNGLKRGYILRMPDRATINTVDPAEALATVKQHHALWREYQQTLAGGEPATAMGAEAGEEAAYSSGIPSRDDDARLEIVSAGEGASTALSSKDPTDMTADELRDQLALAREAIETERVEKEALRGEVGDLEQQVDKMKSLVSIEDTSLAEVQALGETEEPAAAEEAMPGDEVADETAAEITTEEEALAALDELTGEVEPAEAEPAMEETVEAEAAETEAVFVEEQAEEPVAPEAAAPGVEAQQPEAMEPQPMPREEPGLIASLLNSKLLVGGIALLVLVLLAVTYLLVKRRRDAAAMEAEALLAADSEAGLEDVADLLEEEPVAAREEPQVASEEAPAAEPAEEEKFDSESTMVLPSATDTVMTEAPATAEAAAEEDAERDDVIAEADVYLAYGIYQQAEELLNNAIAENPDKDAYRVKLAEAYFASKNAEGLSSLGADMKQRLGGAESPHWNKVVALGKELCPDDEVFQSAEAADLDIDELMPKSPEPMDFDLGEAEGGDEGEVATPDLDLDFGGVDESGLEAPSLDESSMEETAVMPAEELPEAAGEDLGELEFDLSETEAVSEEPSLEMPEAEAAPAAEEEEFSLDLEATDLDLTEEPSLEAEAPAEEVGELEMEADIGDLDLDTGATEETPAEEPALDELSLDDLGGELDEEEPLAEAAPATEAAPAGGEMDLSDIGDVDEINTKLDLARAYIDMGDHDGARDILDEVKSDGNDQQKQEADELLKGLG